MLPIFSREFGAIYKDLIMLYMIAQAIGYLASVFLGISLFVNNDLKFRYINSMGCSSFIIYGILIHQWPIIATNAGLFLINMYYLAKIYRTKEDFDLLDFKKDYQIIGKFIHFYETNIKTYFPEFKLEDITEKDISFIVLRDLVIANIFVATLNEDGTAEVKLNYTVPKYRDYKIGKFLFTKEKDFLIEKGVKRIHYTKVFNRQHEHFLLKTGFACEMENGQASYIKLL